MQPGRFFTGDIGCLGKLGYELIHIKMGLLAWENQLHREQRHNIGEVSDLGSVKANGVCGVLKGDIGGDTPDGSCANAETDQSDVGVETDDFIEQDFCIGVKADMLLKVIICLGFIAEAEVLASVRINNR